MEDPFNEKRASPGPFDSSRSDHDMRLFKKLRRLQCLVMTHFRNSFGIITNFIIFIFEIRFPKNIIVNVEPIRIYIINVN